MQKLLAGALLSLSFLTGAAAQQEPPPLPVDLVIIENSPGGVVDDYLRLKIALRRTNAKVEIKGSCASACTLLVDLPNVCVHPGARLGFHASFLVWRGTYGIRLYDSKLFKVELADYPPKIREWITAHGGLGVDLIWLEGKELERIIPRCKPAVS